MASEGFLETYRIVELTILYGLLVCLGVLSAVWVRLAVAGLSRLLVSLHARGVIRIDGDESARSGPSMPGFDRTFISISGLLERTCQLIPGDPNRHTHPFVLAVLLVGVPIFLGLVTLTFLIPFLLFSYVTVSTSIGVGLLSLGGYAVALVALDRILRRVPRTYRRLRRGLRDGSALA